MATSSRFEIFRDEAGAFRWRLLEDAIELATGLEAFFNDWNAHRSARAFKLGSAEAAYLCSESARGWVWEARAPDGRRLAICPLGLPDRRSAQTAAQRARRAAPGATGP